MKPISFSLNCATQRGWVTLEVALSLALLSTVLYLVERQSESQWQVITHGEELATLRENLARQEVMTLLTGSSSWREAEYNHQQGSYPSCALCTSGDLTQWFQASQGKVASSTLEWVPEDD